MIHLLYIISIRCRGLQLTGSVSCTEVRVKKSVIRFSIVTFGYRAFFGQTEHSEIVDYILRKY